MRSQPDLPESLLAEVLPPERSSDAVLVVGRGGDVTYASHSAGELLKRPPSALLGMPLRSLLHRDSRSWAAGPRGFRDPNPARPVTVRILPATGDPAARDPGTPVQVVVSDLTAHPGVGGYVLKLRPVPEASNHDAERKAAQNRYRLIVDAATVGIWLLDRDGRTVFANPAAQRFSGRRADELLGKPPGTFLRPEDAAHVEVLLEDPHPGVSRSSEVSVARTSRAALRLRVTATPVFGVDGRACGWLMTMADVTDVGRGQADRLGVDDHVERAQKVESIGLLAGQMAHDFNNVLSVILSTTDLALAALPDSSPAAAHLRRLRGAAQHGADITGRLLSYSRPERGTPRVLDVGEVVVSALEILRDSVPAGVRLREDVEFGCLVLADPVQIRQIVMNLVQNAFDATPHGGKVVVFTRQEERDQGGRWTVLGVTDTGCGMEPDVMARAAQPLFTTKPRGAGTGFGLSIVSDIVERAGGDMAVRSTPGEGTTVEIRLPSPEPGAPEGAPGSEPVAHAASNGGATVMLVDDDEHVRDVTRRMLQHHGFGVVEASSGQEALGLAARPDVSFDVVLTDQTMPGMSGVALLQRLELAGFKRPAVVMSGYTADAVLRESDDASFTWLRKPFGGEGLVATIRDALGRGGT